MRAHMSRRLFTCCATLLTCGAMGLATPALAADVWPSQPIKILVGFAAGGGNDIVARILAKELQQSLGQAVVVENKGGAGGLLANEIVAKSPKNGYTLLLGSIGSNTIAPVLAKSFPTTRARTWSRSAWWPSRATRCW